MDKMFIVFIGIFFLVLASFGTALVADRQARAVRASKAPDASEEKSILLSSPKQASVGENITVNAVARSVDDRPVPGANICLTTTLGTVAPTCVESNEAGISTFTLSSTQQGTATVTGTINTSIQIATTVSALFTE